MKIEDIENIHEYLKRVPAVLNSFDADEGVFMMDEEVGQFLKNQEDELADVKMVAACLVYLGQHLGATNPTEPGEQMMITGFIDNSLHELCYDAVAAWELMANDKPEALTAMICEGPLVGVRIVAGIAVIVENFSPASNN